MSDELLVLGIRHHGPGSARGVRAALDAYAPDVVLLEAPADAQDLLTLVTDPALDPPVALLAYAADDPSLAAFWPYASFSPEWQALTWALCSDEPVAVRCIDLPAAQQLALDAAAAGGAEHPDDEFGDGFAGDVGEIDEPDAWADDDLGAPAAPEPAPGLDLLAMAAGYADADAWWSELVERDPAGPPFAAIADAVAAVRTTDGPPLAPPAKAPEHEDLAADPHRRLMLREAHMRQAIRAARKDGFARIAVVCGAFHAPALREPLPPAAADARLLRGLPKRKVRTTWVPWTHGRLADGSADGPGVAAPGWNAHCFAAGASDPVPSWFALVAGALREQGYGTSTAHVIEAVRLATTLTAMRGRSTPGLDEVRDATLSVLCDGDPLRQSLVEAIVLLGERQGTVPQGTPTVALEADLDRRCRSVRLKREPRPKAVELDLRQPNGAARSTLLHQAELLGLGWGELTGGTRRSTGTFRETWTIAWAPELAVRVVDASRWGTTVAGAATAKVCADAFGADVPGLAGLLATSLRADLDEATGPLLAALDRRAAWETDLTPILEAIPALVDTARYGDARGTPLPQLLALVDGLVARVCAGLPQALRGHDLDASRPLVTAIEGVHAAIVTLDDAAALAAWLEALRVVARRADVHPILLGRIARLRLDSGAIEQGVAADELARALSIGPDAETKATWVEGFVSGGGLLLIHDAALLGLLDAWLAGLTDDEALSVIPLLRRAFGALTKPERRTLAGVLKAGLGGAASGTGRGGAGPALAQEGLDLERAAPAVGRAAALLGLDPAMVVAELRGELAGPGVSGSEAGA